MTKRAIAVLAPAFLASMVFAANSLAASAPAPSRGRLIYNAQGCADCHGYVGQGGGAGPRLSAKSISMEMLTHQLRHPSAEMPPYSGKILSDDDVAALQEFIATLK